MQSGLFTTLGAFLLALAPQASAQLADLELIPDDSYVEVGDHIDIQIIVLASGATDVNFSAIDALLDYDPVHIQLLSNDDTFSAEAWFASTFLPDPDGINADITDGDAIYTALAAPGPPAIAPPGGAIVTTLRFLALTPTPATTISFLPSMGAFGVTEVYAYNQPGGVVTGDFSDTAVVHIAEEPLPVCFGETTCPCGNAGGTGEGCENSTGLGAILEATGSVSVANDNLVFSVSQARPGEPSLLVQGGSIISTPFKDGVFCAGNPTERIEVVFLDGTGSGTTTQSIVTNGNVIPGQTLIYQWWYRDPGGISPCLTGSNFSQAIVIEWF
jgi:hypothetical protein